MLSGGALTIVLTANDDTGAHFSCSLRELRIISVIAVFGHQRDVGTHTGKLCAGWCDVIGGNIVAAL